MRSKPHEVQSINQLMAKIVNWSWFSIVQIIEERRLFKGLKVKAKRGEKRYRKGVEE